jgi:His-Xaa-Ser system protein HxsD
MLRQAYNVSMSDELSKMNFVIEDGRLCIYLFKLFYQREAIFAAAQTMTNKYYFEIKPYESEKVSVYLEPKEPIPLDDSEKIALLQSDAKHFCNTVLDHQVRLDLEKEYGKIRELIVRQAFSPITVDELSKELNNK